VTGARKTVFLLVVHKAEARKVGGALAIDLRREGDVVASQNDLLGLPDSLFKERRRDGALVDIEEVT